MDLNTVRRRLKKRLNDITPDIRAARIEEGLEDVDIPLQGNQIINEDIKLPKDGARYEITVPTSLSKLAFATLGIPKEKIEIIDIPAIGGRRFKIPKEALEKALGLTLAGASVKLGVTGGDTIIYDRMDYADDLGQKYLAERIAENIRMDRRLRGFKATPNLSTQKADDGIDYLDNSLTITNIGNAITDAQLDAVEDIIEKLNKEIPTKEKLTGLVKADLEQQKDDRQSARNGIQKRPRFSPRAEDAATGVDYIKQRLVAKLNGISPQIRDRRREETGKDMNLPDQGAQIISVTIEGDTYVIRAQGALSSYAFQELGIPTLEDKITGKERKYVVAKKALESVLDIESANYHSIIQGGGVPSWAESMHRESTRAAAVLAELRSHFFDDKGQLIQKVEFTPADPRMKGRDSYKVTTSANFKPENWEKQISPWMGSIGYTQETQDNAQIFTFSARKLEDVLQAKNHDFKIPGRGLA